MGLMKAAALALAAVFSVRADAADDRAYARVLTSDGEVLEGYIRWDRNEVAWADFLDGGKAIPWEHVHQAEQLDEKFRRQQELARSLTIGDVRITWDEDDEDDPKTVSAGVRLGHLRSLEVIDDRKALLVLKSGEQLELGSGSSDIGRGFRGLVVEDRQRGEVNLRWRELDRVDFMAAPAETEPPRAWRLYGTVHARGGLALTGFVGWDLDESLTADTLDGRQDGRTMRIPFGTIASIAREASTRSRVTLTNGEVLVLRGSNDVNSENRGIEVSDPMLGRATLTWDEFDSVEFFAAPRSLAPYDSFDGGRRLRGAVATRDGRRLAGQLRWDNDEEYTWETIDGEVDGVRLGIELGDVNSIERTGSNGARVRLLDGRAFELGGSSDVDETNKGIFVELEGGETVLVRWDDFESVTFDR
jgi:hypothetical protein